MLSLSAFVVVVSSVMGQVEAEQPVLPENVSQELDFFVGKWTVEGEVTGESLKGRFVVKWAPQKHCLVITYPLTQDGRKLQGNGVMGWDTATEEVMSTLFFSDGVLEIARYKIESPGVFKGTYRGSIQGQEFEAECHLVKKLPNEWTFKTKGNKIGGKPEGELSVRFVRASEKPKAKGTKAKK